MKRLVVMLAVIVVPAVAQVPAPFELRDHWQVQSSATAREGGGAISTPDFAANGWYPTQVPATVLAVLVENKVYPDPYVGMNLRNIPGTTYPIGRNFANLPMDQASPFRVPWWYRTTFTLPAAMRGKRVALHLDGVNYRANLWLNGQQIARADSVVGTYRLHEIDITDGVNPKGLNVLAAEISAPDVTDLAMTWVDWNPAPPDKDMGLWRPVYLTASGPVLLRNPHVFASVDTATLKSADLTASIRAENATDRPLSGVVRGNVGGAVVERAITLAPHEKSIVRFTPLEYPHLHFRNPRLWWPVGMGDQPLYDASFTFLLNGSATDRATTHFGIREITGAFNDRGARQFRINGKRILIRGGGWAPDMMVRVSPERQEAEIRYARDMGLNTIRFEGKLEDEHFLDLADRYGMLIFAGWSCCDAWEKWNLWTREDTMVSAQSQRDQINRLRNRPSLLAWLNGSDGPPPAEIEREYIRILDLAEFRNPFISSASQSKAQFSGASGVKMTGPYDWVPPGYWMADTANGGAWGFNTETSPGAAVPPYQSLAKMFGGSVPWPIDSLWLFHAASGRFANLNSFTAALNARYGPTPDAESYANKSQLMTYEGERAMFEAYSRNRGVSTGVIQWMLNDAWPGLWWHLYDYYLRPGGGYFGAKKALEPVHPLYSYDDRSIVVVNGSRQPVRNAKLTVRALKLDGSPLYSADSVLSILPDSVARLMTVPAIDQRTYLLDLRLTSASGAPLSINTYWLSSTMDDLDWAKTTYYITPAKSYADFTRLDSMPKATVDAGFSVKTAGQSAVVSVKLKNTSKVPAFFLRLSILNGKTGDEFLPVLWTDNYITLMPGETRTLSATIDAAALAAARKTGGDAFLHVAGLNWAMNE